ncbi:hypothetical protein HYV84_07175 [Candidatus Woesearchaeota archaeon]|nr:hypothetical protein [Candidatus Woesearchaeota archaeon]
MNFSILLFVVGQAANIKDGKWRVTCTHKYINRKERQFNVMSLTIPPWVNEKYPELSREVDEFEKILALTREKQEVVREYSLHGREQNISGLRVVIKRLKNLLAEEKGEVKAEKKFTIRLAARLEEKGSTALGAEGRELLSNVQKLGELLSGQIALFHKDALQWGLKVKFHHFLRLVKEEEILVRGEEKFLETIERDIERGFSDELKANAEKVLNIGHRGARELCPENTLKSMRLGLTFNVGMIEFDVQRCKTGELVIMHDDTVDRTTTGKGRVVDLSLDALRKLNVKDAPGEKIPLFTEVIELLERKCQMDIELKIAVGLRREEKYLLAQGVKEALDRYRVHHSRFIIHSFDRESVEIIKRMDLRYSTGIAFENFAASVHESVIYKLKRVAFSKEGGRLNRAITQGYIRKTKSAGASVILPPLDIVDKGMVDAAHNDGLKVIVWTVNNPYFMFRLLSMGVDGIITDRPDILQEVKASVARGNISGFSKYIDRG